MGSVPSSEMAVRICQGPNVSIFEIFSKINFCSRIPSDGHCRNGPCCSESTLRTSIRLRPLVLQTWLLGSGPEVKSGAQWLLGSGPKVKSLPLGSGPKVKSQATVLWRQTRGLRQDPGAAPRPGGCARPEGCAKTRGLRQDPRAAAELGAAGSTRGEGLFAGKLAKYCFLAVI